MRDVMNCVPWDWTWLHRWALWTIASPLFYAGAAALIAYLYQKSLKRFEMRWDTYKEMVENMNDCFLQSTRLCESIGALQTKARDEERTAQVQKMHSQHERLREIVKSAVALRDRSETLFSESVLRPWTMMTASFMLFVNDRDSISYQKSRAKEASDMARKASIAACKEIGMPFKKTSEMMKADIEASRTQEGKNQ